jgi:large subunit ribosomal protein L24
MMKKNKLHVKIDDKIKIIAGNEKGLVGTINSIFQDKSMAIIEGVVPRIKYKKKTPNGDSQKLEIPYLIHTSNLMLWDNQANQSSRIGYKVVENTKKRYFKKSGNIL